MDAGGFQAKSDSFDEGDAGDRISVAASASSELRPITAPCERLQTAWRKLARNASEPNIFYESCLLEPALNYFGGDPDLHFFLFWAGKPDKSDLLGLLPIGPARQFGRWPIPHVQNWLHNNAFLGTPLVRAGFENQFWTALFAVLDGKKWPGFFHINSLTVGGELDRALRAVCERQGRRCDLVHSQARALLQNDLGPDDYYSATVKTKKRKELRRQARRLAEAGEVEFSHHRDNGHLDQWIGEFLELERRGWKGQNRSALDCDANTQNFFREALAGAAAEGQLERLDLRLDGRPVAMLVNFLSAPGGFGFKTAYDEDYARFSPGVLLQRENLKILDDPSIEWMDSCAAEDHPMIDSLWTGRRHIGRFSIELKGLSRTAVFRGVRLGEDLMAHLKGREIVDVMRAQR